MHFFPATINQLRPQYGDRIDKQDQVCKCNHICNRQEMSDDDKSKEPVSVSKHPSVKQKNSSSTPKLLAQDN